MQAAIFVAVVEVGSHALADDKAVLLVDRDVARIEDAVNIAAKQYAVRKAVTPSEGIRLDVSGVEGGKDLSARNGALSLVRVSHRCSERALAKSRCEERGFSVSCRGFGKARRRVLVYRAATVQYLLPKFETFPVFR